MAFPDKIKLLDHEYAFSVEPYNDLDECWGRANPMRGWIKIAVELGNDHKFSTLLHEVVHCICDLNDLGKGDENLKEHTISIIAAGVYSFIKSNPEIIRDMLGDN